MAYTCGSNNNNNNNNSNPSGGGRFDFDDGGTYCGGWEDGKAHGHGICTGPKGQGEYSGAWHYGYEVSGVYTWPSGNSYEGQWQNGKRHGLGVELRGRWIYKGEWTNGCKGRYGTKNSVNSQSKYEGTWAGGLQDGYGIETYADGGIYQGQWLRGMRHGYGIRKSAPYSVAAKYRSRSHAYASLTSLRSDQGDDSTDKDKRSDDNKGGFVLRARSEPPSRRRSLSEKSMAFRRTIWQGFRIKKQRSTGDIDNRVATGSIKSSGSTGSCGSDESGTTRHSGGTGSGGGGVEEFVDPNAVETYAGEWKNDRRSGFGVSERSDGLKYEGEWFNNKKYGYGLTTFKDGRREEGKYKNNVLLTSQRCRNMIFIRASKLKERVEVAVQSALRASTIAIQKAEIGAARATTSVDRCSQASVASQQAREDCEIARLTASSFAPDFFQPGLARKPLLDLVGNHVDTRMPGVNAASLISTGDTDSPADLSAAHLAPQEPQATAMPPTSSASFPPEPPPSSNFQSTSIPSSVQTRSNPPAAVHHHTVGFVDTIPPGATSRTLPPTADESKQPPLRPTTSSRNERTVNGQAPPFFPPPLPTIPPYFQMTPGGLTPNAFYPAAAPMAYPFAAPAPYNKSLNDELMYAMHLASQKMYLQQMTAYYQQQQQMQQQQQQMRFRVRQPQQMQQPSFGDSNEQFYSASESLNGSRRQSSDESLLSPIKKNNSNLLRYPQTGPSTDRLDVKQEQRRRPASRSQRGTESPGCGDSRISLNQIVYDYFDQYNNSNSSRGAFAVAPGLAQSRAERYRRRLGGNRGPAAVNFTNLNSPRDYIDYSGSSTEEVSAPGARRSTLATPTTVKHASSFNPSSTLPFLPEACCSTTSVSQRPFMPPSLLEQSPNAARFKPATLQKFNLDNYLSSNDSASLPDLACLDGAEASTGPPSGFSRQETARLCSQRRQELQRMREEADLLRANPLRSVRYLYHPVVRAWIARWKFPLLVLIMNICLTTMFYKLVTYSKRFTGDDKDDPGGTAANDDEVD